ncbi:MAG: hypothetical protein GY861_17890 [bacterium]|nr:hypothetical protein [bacterium]
MVDLLDIFSENELKTTNVKNLKWFGIHPTAWDYSRGAKTVRRYIDSTIPEDGSELRVAVEYSYVMDEGNRNIIDPIRTIKFYESDGLTVFMEQEISKPMTVKSLGELNQEVRAGRITDLVKNAEQLPSGQTIVDSLYEWYGTEIDDYVGVHGSLSFENALKAEADVARLAMLDTQIVEFGGVSVMQLLAFQLVGNYAWT